MSSKKKSASNKDSYYLVDVKLIPRMRQYLAGHANHKNFSVGTMAKELQMMYSDYARKKRTAFLKSVEKAYEVICNDEQSSEETEDFTSQLEKKHLANKSTGFRYKEDCLDIESDTTDKSFSSDNTDYVLYKDTNMMNNFMTNIYQNNKTTPKAEKSSSFMDVPSHLNVSKPSVSPGKSSAPYLASSASSAPLENNLHYSVPGKPGSAKTSSSPANARHHNKPSQQSLPSATSSSYGMNHVPVQMASYNRKSHSSHSYPMDTVNLAKDRPIASSIRKGVDSKKLPSHNLSQKSNLLHATPDHDATTKMPKDSAVPTNKRPRMSDRSGQESHENNGQNKEFGFQISTVTFADIGGNEQCLKEICKILVHMKHPEIHRQLGVTPPRGILLHGPPGCGKTLLANAIAGELQLPFMKLAATELVSGVSGESEQKMRNLFEKARSKAPCVIFLDEVDVITPKRENASKDMERRIVAQLLACMDDLNDEQKSPENVMVIGATNRPDSLDPALRRAGRFDREICMGIPDERARKRILQVLCRNLKLTPDFNFGHLAHLSPGFVGADLAALAREAAMMAVSRVFNELENQRQVENSCRNQDEDGDAAVPMEVNSNESINNQPEEFVENHISSNLMSMLGWLREQAPLTETQLQNLFITMEDFLEALKLVQPSAKREGFATIPDVTWDDIGALHDIREELKIAILAPVRFPEHFKSLGLTRAPGILLAGPPGCGKTLLAKAIANESGINFISVKGPELLNMYVGESERAVRQVFQRARNSAPCVIFFDELDSLCPRRHDSGEGGASVRVVNQMLTEMDGLEERKQVFIMAATNRPDIIDPAILRPGRMDKILYVGLPSAADRLDILNTITKNGTKPAFDDKDLLKNVASDDRCRGFTGADLSSLIREASINTLRASITGNVNQKDLQTGLTINSDHIEQAFIKVKPSVTIKEHEKYETMKARLKS